jgi:tripartite-type tricarboxylate transporter receptor subunit TctC
MKLVVRALAAAFAIAVSAGAASAQYPDKPVRLVVPFPPGGPTDVFARVLATGLAGQLGQQVVIENKAGAGGTVGSEMVAKARPDGYTLLFGTAATHGINVSLYSSLPYDPLKDFELVALAGLVPMVLLVPPGQPRTLKALVAKLKAEPGKWSYASSGNGTTNHLAGELFKKKAGLDVEHVPYRGSAPALQDLMAGRVAFMFDSFGTTLEQIKAGKLHAVAVMADKRSQVMTDVPTTAEAGLLLEKLARQMVGRAVARGRVAPLTRLGLELSDQRLERRRHLERGCRAGRHAQGHRRQAQHSGEQGPRRSRRRRPAAPARHRGRDQLRAGQHPSLRDGRDRQVARSRAACRREGRLTCPACRRCRSPS